MNARDRAHRSAVGLLVALALLVGWGAPAHASGYPPIVQSNTNQMFAMFNFGPSIGIDPSGAQFKIAQEFGYHLMGGGDGPAIGASLEEGFGNGLFRLMIGPKLWWDFQVAPGLGLYLTPTAKIGYALWSVQSGGSNHYFNFQFGFEVRLVLANRAIIMFRPFTLDMGGGGGDYTQGFVATYDLMFGGGVAF